MKTMTCCFIIFATIFLNSYGQEKNRIPSFSEKILDAQAPSSLWMKTIGDINRDGKTDILVGGRKGGGMVAYLAPDWQKVSINNSLKISTDAEVIDVNNDNHPDIVAVLHNAIAWFEGPDWKVHFIEKRIGHDVEVADFNGDGMADVVVRNQGEFGDTGGHTLWFYIQKSGGEWKKYQKEIADGEGLKVADISGDKQPDIITNGFWFENTGNATNWIEHRFTNTWDWPNTAIDIADVNNDGRTDIVLSPSELAGTHFRISWFEAPKNPRSIWKENVIVDSVETVIHSINTADFNNDGKTDVVIAEMQQGTDPDEVAIFFNSGKNNWYKQVISKNGSHSMRVADFDDDGDIDILGANWRENKVKMWENGLN